MDKNTVIGTLLLILVIFGYYSIYPPDTTNTESKQESSRQENIIIKNENEIKNNVDKVIDLKKDTIEEKFFVIENNLIKLNISNHGGYVNSVEVKNFQTHEKSPLILFDKDSSFFRTSKFIIFLYL